MHWIAPQNHFYIYMYRVIAWKLIAQQLICVLLQPHLTEVTEGCQKFSAEVAVEIDKK